MKDTIAKLIDVLLEFYKKNYKKPRLWIGMAVIAFCFILLFPYIDSNFFYFSRIEKRIGVLEKVMELDEAKINSNEVYKNEYQSILQEIEQQSDRSVNSVMNRVTVFRNSIISSDNGNGRIKFFTGAGWCLLVTIFVPFMDTFNKRSDKILAIFLMLLLSIFMGAIFTIIPVFFTPMVNYIGIPVLQIIIVIVIVSKKDNNRKCKVSGTQKK